MWCSRYRFSRRDLLRNGTDTFASRVGKRSIPVVLDWAIRNGSCQSASSACASSNSYCVNATQGPGYLCKCSQGYAGNPYATGPDDGCTSLCSFLISHKQASTIVWIYIVVTLAHFADIDECARPTDFPCNGECKDTQGSYECSCRAGYESDGDPKEKPCRPKLSTSAKLIIGIHFTHMNLDLNFFFPS